MPETNKNVQTKITDIYEKYHASVKNFGNYVENSSYIIDTANNQNFSNISNFLCTAFFKDSTAIENSETELSTEFGNILIDYCEKGLSHENILSLLNLVKDYTDELNSIFKEEGKYETINGNDLPTKWKYGYGINIDKDKTLSTLSSNKYINRLAENAKMLYTARYLINAEYMKKLASIPEGEKDDVNKRNAIYTDIASKYNYDRLYTESKKISDIESNFILNYLINLIEYNNKPTKYDNAPIQKGSYLYQVGVENTDLSNIDTSSDAFAEYIVKFMNFLEKAAMGAEDASSSFPKATEIVGLSAINLNEHNIIVETESGLSVSQVANLGAIESGTSSPIVLNNFIICDYYQNPNSTGKNNIIKIHKKRVAFKLFNKNELNQYRTNFLNNTLPNNQVIFGYSATSNGYDVSNNFQFINGNSNLNKDEPNYALGMVIIDDGEETTTFSQIDNYDFSNGNIKMLQATITSDYNNADNAGNLKDFINRMSAIYNGTNFAENETIELSQTPISAEYILTASYTNSDFTLSYLLKDLYLLYDFVNYEKIRSTTMNIIYDFAQPSSQEVIDENTIISNSDLNDVNNQEYLTVIKLTNINLYEYDNETDREIIKVLRQLLGYKFDSTNINYVGEYGSKEDAGKFLVDIVPSSGQPLTRATIYILYKELNNELRTIESSDLNEELFSAFYVIREHTLPYTYLNSEFELYNDERIISSNELEVLKSTYSNPYLARIAKKYDIISYKYGSLIGYGTNDTEINEINEFISLYKETRDYFYKVQFNKAFALDELYNVYCLMYIITFTINRWFTAKIVKNKDINYYNLTDCKNFFESYGMEDVADIIMVNEEGIAISTFFNQLEYCKRVISNYSELAKYKGSKYIIDLLSQIFTDDINFITVDKYLIFEDLRDNSIKFLSVPYTASNSVNTLNNNISNAENYYDVTESDIYWNGDSGRNGQYNLPEDVIVDYKISPQSTKYLGLSISTNISDIYYRTRYSFALFEYLVDCLYSSEVDATTSLYTIISKIYYTVNIGTDTNMNIATLMQMIFTLFKEYEMCNMLISQINNENVQTESTKKTKQQEASTTPTYFNINRKATYETFIENLNKNGLFKNIHEFIDFKNDGVLGTKGTDVIHNFIDDFYKHNLYYLNNGSNEVYVYEPYKPLDEPSSDEQPFGTPSYYYFSLKELNVTAEDINSENGKINKTDGTITNPSKPGDIIYLQTSTNNVYEPIIPLYLQSYSNFYSTISDTNFFFNYFKETMSEKNYSDEDADLNFVEQLQDIMKKLSPIIMMNSNNNVLKTNSEGVYSEQNAAELKKGSWLFNARYQYNKFTNASSDSYSNSDLYPDDADSGIGIQTVYDNILSDMINFPLRYLEGSWQVSQNTTNNYMFYNYDVRTFLDTIFETFYVSEEEPGIKIYNIDSDGIVTPIGLQNDDNDTGIQISTDKFFKKFNFRVNRKNDSGGNAIGSSLPEILQVIQYTFGDLYNTRDITADMLKEPDVSIHLFPDITTTIEQLQNISSLISEKINNLVEALNGFLVGIDDISVYFNIGENRNEMIDFIVELVKLFISYTTYLYSISANNVYDNKYESIPFTDDYNDTLSNYYTDDAYYDENFKIKIETYNDRTENL